MSYRFAHHREAIDRVAARFGRDPEVVALLLGGSIAHGYATPKSDVDILIVVSDEAYERRKSANALLFYDKELAGYDDGYVDGKYISADYLRLVAEKGNEPTRYAFKDSRVLFSRADEIPALVTRAASFPLASKESNSIRFYAQIHAWKWHFYEGLCHGNEFLISTSVDRFVLFCARLILNYNEMLYPYLKWLFAELEKAPAKPVDFDGALRALVQSKDPATLEAIVGSLKAMHDWGLGDWDWPSHFHRDVESVWLRHESAISDI